MNWFNRVRIFFGLQDYSQVDTYEKIQAGRPRRLFLVLYCVITGVLLGSSPRLFAQANANLGITLLASAARTATPINTADQVNLSWRGAHIIINVSAYTTGTYTPTIQGKDPVTGNYYTLLAGAALSGTGTTIMRVYPGLTAAANVTANDFLPRTWRVTFMGSATPAMTFSVGGFLAN